MKRRYLLILSSLLFAQSIFGQVIKKSLNSSDENVWQIKPQADLEGVRGEHISTLEFEMENCVQGVVPGIVFTAYVESGKEQDPNYADNIYKVDETFYNRPFWYRTKFKLPENYSKGQRVWLCFDNTNRFADFYFNGIKISGNQTSTRDVSGHMLRSKFDVTELLNQNGENAVAVLITDADQKKTRTAKDPYGIACSPSYLAGAGWDWMPYVPGRLAGITGNVYLAITGDVVMVDPWVRSDLPSLQRANLSISTNLKNTSDSPVDVTLSGIIKPGNIRFSKTIQLAADTIENISFSASEFKQLIIDEPKLWWPNGYGEPNLYDCELTCKIDGKVSDKQNITFGIRKYDYKMVDNSVGYPVMHFYINGQRIFLKGGNWGMSEYLLRRHGKEYETVIKLHKDLNYNMIRLWTGCVTDDEFYEYCDQYGIMVWDDFWIYVAYNNVAQPEAFKANALDKVRRLRNHASIALWCGANETHPNPDLDGYLREMIAREDNNDRLYKSCSNKDGLSGSGWWANFPPKHHFETSASNLAFAKPAYPYGIDHGYGLRSEIGTATFPTFESIREFIPEKDWWPLPTDEQLQNDPNTVWNKHFFGKEAWNAKPTDYKKAVNEQFGESENLEEFCEKAQLLNIEVVKGMYEAWNDKMWNDASGLLLWMSHPAYPSFVWQTYDYYYDPTGAYWGAKKACEHLHIQWNAFNNSIKVINTTAKELRNVCAKASVYNLNGDEVIDCRQIKWLNVLASNTAEAFVLDFTASHELTPLHFIRLQLLDDKGNLLSENFYWRNGIRDLDYKDLNTLPEVDLVCTLRNASISKGTVTLVLENQSQTVSFANRLRLVNRASGQRVLPIIMSDNYVTLMPGEKKEIQIETFPDLLKDKVDVLLKQYGKAEKQVLAF